MTATVGRGGMETHYVELCSALAAKGVEVLAVADPSFAERLSPQVRHIPVKMHGSRLNPLRLMRLAKALRGAKADIVHSHASKATAMTRLIWPLVSKRGCGPRHVATIHGMKRQVRAYRQADMIIGVSGRLARAVGHPRGRVIYNGRNFQPLNVDRSYLASIAGLDPSRPVLVTAGRLAPVKGFDVLIEAMVNLDAQLLIAGEGPEHAALAARAEALGVADRVFLLGHRDDVAALFAASDLGVISSHREGFSYVMVEMLQAGLPIVGTDVADLAELVGEQWVVEPGRPELLHARLREGLAAGDLREQMEPRFAWARTELTLDRMADRTIAAYRELLERP